MPNPKYVSSGTYKPLPILPGDKYHSWTVVRPLGQIKKWANHYWECVCDCGTVSHVNGTVLVNGRSKHCKSGVHMKGRNQTHGMKYTRIYATWANMKRRCNNPKCSMYYLYGGRGITVCDRWKQGFQNFYEDMKDGYSEDLQLDRIDVNGNYFKENCRWATRIEQGKNKRNNVYLTYKGETKLASEWAILVGAKIPTVIKRIRMGWTPEECLYGQPTYLHRL